MVAVRIGGPSTIVGMTWLIVVPTWCLAVLVLVALCRAGHLEDVARGFTED